MLLDDLQKAGIGGAAGAFRPRSAIASRSLAWCLVSSRTTGLRASCMHIYLIATSEPHSLPGQHDQGPPHRARHPLPPSMEKEGEDGGDKKKKRQTAGCLGSAWVVDVSHHLPLVECDLLLGCGRGRSDWPCLSAMVGLVLGVGAVAVCNGRGTGAIAATLQRAVGYGRRHRAGGGRGRVWQRVLRPPATRERCIVLGVERRERGIVGMDELLAQCGSRLASLGCRLSHAHDFALL